MTDPEALVRAYYESLDSGTYDRLESLLTPEFVHERPEMTLSGRAEFLQFMRDKRPRTDTTHPIETVYRAGADIAVEGRLVGGEKTITGFVDLFTLSDGQITRIKTYTD
jgi:ketosteroid isomerase-like protein